MNLIPFIVATIIALARTLNLTVIAEGVETEDQHNLLRDMGCDQIQGYLVSRPLPFDAMTAYLRAHAQGKGSATPAPNA